MSLGPLKVAHEAVREAVRDASLWFDKVGYPTSLAPHAPALYAGVAITYLQCYACGATSEETPRKDGMVSEDLFDWVMQHDPSVAAVEENTDAGQRYLSVLRTVDVPFQGMRVIRLLGTLAGRDLEAGPTIRWAMRARATSHVADAMDAVAGLDPAHRWSRAPARVEGTALWGRPVSHRAAVRAMRDWRRTWWGPQWMPTCCAANLDRPAVLAHAIGRLPEPSRSLLLLGDNYYEVLMHLCAADVHRAQALWMCGFSPDVTPVMGCVRLVELGLLPVPGPVDMAGYVSLEVV